MGERHSEYWMLKSQTCTCKAYYIFQGFDEYMNLVLDDAEEVHMKTKNRKPLGKMFF